MEESRGLAVIFTGSAGRTMTPASGILLDEKFPSFYEEDCNYNLCDFSGMPSGIGSMRETTAGRLPRFFAKTLLDFSFKVYFFSL